MKTAVNSLNVTNFATEFLAWPLTDLWLEKTDYV